MEEGTSGGLLHPSTVMDVIVPEDDNHLPVSPPLDTVTEALDVIVRQVINNGVEGKSVVLVSYKNQEYRVAIPPGLCISPLPHEGDHLLLTTASQLLEEGVVQAVSVQYTRRREDVLVRLTDVHQANNGQRFVFFEKNACCDVDAMPQDAVLEVGTWFRVSLVESRQPKRRQWRAYEVERLLDEGAAQHANDLDEGIAMTGHLDFGQITFGEVACKTINIQNVDMSGPRTMDRMSVAGCPIKLISPVEISDVHFEGMTPDRFYPSIDFHPFKSVRYNIPPMVSVQLSVRVTGVTVGKFRCGVRVHFHGQLRKVCEVTVDIVGKDPSSQPQVVPGETDETCTTKSRRGARSSFDRRREEAERLNILVESAKKDGIVPGPSRILNVEEKRPERRRALLRNCHPLPVDLLAFLNTPEATMDSLLARFPTLKLPLDEDKYDQHFHLLLYLEEHQEALDVRQFDMISSEMERLEDGQFKLKMHHLQEHRPSLVRGDLLSLRALADLDGPRFHGRINSVEMDCVKFACDPTFNGYCPKYSTWDFAFMINRNTYKKLHEMVNFTKHSISRRLLFPSLAHRQSCADRISANLAVAEPIKFCNETLDHSQRNAVRMVVTGKCQPMAHVVFGPPGTGKTVTLVEIILQLYLTCPKGRILVCAPSNAAVDLIGAKIMDSGCVPPNALRRLLGFSRNPLDVPASLLASVQTGCEEMLKDGWRIILTTCLGAAFLFQLVHDFTHVVMDEAGFCTEPEALMPLAAAAGRPDLQVVLAGDPNQLGPVIFSPFAKELGLAKSLMCRLLELPAYRDATSLSQYCPLLVSKLEVSYRAVPSLLKIPGQLFYNEELKSSLKDSQNVYAERLGIPSLTFWPVKSQEFRESRSPSIYNPGQVFAVVMLLKGLLAVGLATEDIAVITPYRLQVSKIRDGVMKERLDEEGKLKIGTVDELQGQERKAVILSTVRARKWQEKEEEQVPIKSVLGFVACPKRINVALTRAKFLMIIIGDPHLLALDKHWRSILRYCVAKDLYQRDVYNDKEYCPPLSVQGKNKQQKKRQRLDPAGSDGHGKCGGTFLQAESPLHQVPV